MPVFHSLHAHTFSDDKDLIYEGIATLAYVYTSNGLVVGRQRPDLRRDCDDTGFIEVNSPVVADDKDLIYEGIATAAVIALEIDFSATTKT